MKKIQVLAIHGGNTFKKEKDYLKYLREGIRLGKRVRWCPEYLGKALGNKFDVIAPRMPLQDRAKYRDWAILFKRYIDWLGGEFILIGSSLGGIFLARYLSENKLPKKPLAVYIVCPPFDNSLPGEELSGGFKLKKDLSLIEENCKNVTLMFSKDDKVVPIYHAEKYRNKLKNSKIIIYKSKNGHFNISKFPEIVKMIKSNVKK